ncbi:MAG: hypothetical protein M1817_000254 [Caeruleum heppii]|nr:MAG: hypothetical protein M1817_000254 [Caeruleum heppii]
MRVLSTLTLLLAGTPFIHSYSIPEAAKAALAERHAEPEQLHEELAFSDLEKRRGGGGSSGGGGGGGGGGRGGGSSSSSSGSSGSYRSSSRVSSSSSSGSGPKSGSGSGSGSGASVPGAGRGGDLGTNRRGGGRGGRGGGSRGSSSSGSRGSSSGGSSGGSGSSVSRPRISPSYGGGRFYGGGATTPFRAGGRSPRGIAPFILPLAALSIFPGIWLYSAYAYNYNNPYYFRNASQNAVAQRYPVQCLCQQYSECGCDDNDDDDFLTSILPNGTDTNTLNRTLVAISDVNGTKTIVLNGTLPNGSSEITAGSTSSSSSSAGFRQAAFEHVGWWVMVAVVGSSVWLI